MKNGIRLKDLKSGYAVLEGKNFIKYNKNAFVTRVVNDKDDAIYNAESLTRCDGIHYIAYDCKSQARVR